MAKNKHISIGRLGEDVATTYLQNKGFDVFKRNFRQKCGEIDIIAQKDGVLHFVEVKSGSYTGDFPKDGTDTFRPEDHMHGQKRKRLARVIQVYLDGGGYSDDQDWTVDLLVVHINTVTKRAKVHTIENVLLE